MVSTGVADYKACARALLKVTCIFYFILLASPNKQTKQLRIQKNIGKDTATAVANYSGPDTNKNWIITRHVKKYSNTEKTTTTYNKLLDGTRDEHYCILNR